MVQSCRLIPTHGPSTTWHITRHVLEQVASAHDQCSGGATAVDGRRRPWELRSTIHAKFKSFIEEGRTNDAHGEGHEHPASCLSRLHEDGIRYSMDGAIELRSEHSIDPGSGHLVVVLVAGENVPIFAAHFGAAWIRSGSSWCCFLSAWNLFEHVLYFLQQQDMLLQLLAIDFR